MTLFDLSNKIVAEVPWDTIPEGLLYLRTLRSFRRNQADRLYIDPFVEQVFRSILPSRLAYEVFNYHRPSYNEDLFMDNLHAFKSTRLPCPHDWDSYQNSIDSDYHYSFTSYGFDQFNALDTNWQASAGFGYGSSKKGDPGVVERAYRTANALGLNYRNGTRLTLDQYTPDLALVKPEPSPKDKEKLRPVWGVAFHNWILSALSGQPAMKAAPSIHDGYPLIHNINPQIDIPRRYSYFDDHYPDHHWYQLDWSHLDADIQLFESKTYDSRMIERAQFNGDELAASAFHFSTEWRSHGTVVAPNGRKYVRNGNVGSGDSLTYHKDSETSHRRLRYLLKDFEADYCPKSLVTLEGGDDGIIGIPSNVQLPLKQLSHDALKYFNATLNSSKFEYAYQARNLSLFKVEANPCYYAQRKKDLVSVLGRTLVPLSTPQSGSISTARVRMICEATGWANNYLTRSYLMLRSLHGEADRSSLPYSYLRSLERSGAMTPFTSTNFTKALLSL